MYIFLFSETWSKKSFARVFVFSSLITTVIIFLSSYVFWGIVPIILFLVLILVNYIFDFLTIAITKNLLAVIKKSRGVRVVGASVLDLVLAYFLAIPLMYTGFEISQSIAMSSKYSFDSNKVAAIEQQKNEIEDELLKMNKEYFSLLRKEKNDTVRNFEFEPEDFCLEIEELIRGQEILNRKLDSIHSALNESEQFKLDSIHSALNEIDSVLSIEYAHLAFVEERAQNRFLPSFSDYTHSEIFFYLALTTLIPTFIYQIVILFLTVAKAVLVVFRKISLGFFLRVLDDEPEKLQVFTLTGTFIGVLGGLAKMVAHFIG